MIDGGAQDIMVIMIRNGHDDPNLNPVWGCLHFA